VLETTPRAVCYDCHKPQLLCICARVPRVDNRTHVVVVQHPRERLHPIGTARFAKLGLSRVRVEVAWNAGEREAERPAWVPEGAVLLYPSPTSRDLSELPPGERPSHLVVIDGTWHTARTLYRDKAWLRSLPQVRFSPAAPSRYRIRREPSLDYVSTLEAIVEALRVLEPETEGLDALLAAFDHMIDEQLVFIRRGQGATRSCERRPREWRRTPKALIEDFARLVVTYAESSRPHPRGPRSIVQFAAVALTTGAVFERFLLPESGVPGSAHLSHMSLSASDFDGAVSREAFQAAWAEFLSHAGADPLVSAWNQSTLDLLAAELGGEASRVSLKSAYRNVRGGGSGSLEDVAALEGLAPAPFGFRGRAGMRMGRAIAVARHLNTLAHAQSPAEGAEQPREAPAAHAEVP
jgi:DTW domain-containing protein